MREDRRLARRARTLQEILDAAVAQMAEEGVAGLSLSEVARAVGMRPPSLYEYFPSKLAVYDALFERGMRACLAVLESYRAGLATDPVAALLAAGEAQVAWALANPVLAQLMYWRPVPRFQPSETAFGPALAQVRLLGEALAAAVAAGQLSAGAADEDGLALYTAVVAGVISQQLANEPGVSAADGRFSRLTGTALRMFFTTYAGKGGAA